MARFGIGRGHIGLDIGTSAVRAAEVRGGQRPTVARFGQVLLPRGAVTDGEVQEPEIVAQAITALWKRAGFSSRTVRIGVSNRRVVTRQIELPAMAPADLEGAIRFQAQDYIPIPLSEAVMDYEVIEEITGAEGQALIRVLVVAAERAMVEPLLSAVRQAKLEAEVLELNAYPLMRALGSDMVSAAEVEAIVDVGGGVTNVVIHQAGKPRFTRMLPSLGGDDFTQAVAEALDLEWEDAESLKHRASSLLGRQLGGEPSAEPLAPFTRPETEPFATGTPEDEEAEEDDFLGGLEPLDDEEPTDVLGAREPEPTFGQPEPLSTPPVEGDVERAAEILQTVLQRFVGEVRGSVDFYTTQGDALPLGHVILSGGGALLGGLSEQLSAALRVPVEVGRVFSRVPAAKVKLSQEEMAVAEPFLGVAVGLALGGLED